ncbi:MAG: phosphoribosylamine--glycine ligase, partial [Candidatus Diapherotrites archaeon]|nr:phosphoribosylamine--glycine ligase [Candidatus Diapherotrites archaeon]
VDEFESRSLKIFGPSKKAAMLEGSKAFSKEVMKAAGVPTAGYFAAENFEEAKKNVLEKNMQKAAVKADGLAAGKGVLICNSQQEIIKALEKIFVEKAFGSAGKKAVVEDLLSGEEASVLAFCDGSSYTLMASSQDHKRALDGDNGLNTGGMGAYSPAPVVTEEMQLAIGDNIVEPVLREMQEMEIPFKGVLYLGLMIVEGKPHVLEFNVRFGDPEAQVVIPRMEFDLAEVMLACCNGTLSDLVLDWNSQAATCVVMASQGYPEKYEKGKEIQGLKEAAATGAIVFHAGTKLEKGKVVTDGGRVLGVTALGNDIKESIENAYKAVKKIRFQGAHFRKDIGHRALERPNSKS